MKQDSRSPPDQNGHISAIYCDAGTHYTLYAVNFSYAGVVNAWETFARESAEKAHAILVIIIIIVIGRKKLGDDIWYVRKKTKRRVGVR